MAPHRGRNGAAGSGGVSRPVSGPEVLPRGRLDRLARGIARLFRQAHVTPEEIRYVVRRAKVMAGIRGRTPRPARLPEILTPEELGRILAEAYRLKPRDGLILRLLFESGVRVSELIRLQGVPLDVVQLLLGHADPRTTQLYARLSLGAARAEYDKAMAALAGSRANSPVSAKGDSPPPRDRGAWGRVGDGGETTTQAENIERRKDRHGDV